MPISDAELAHRKKISEDILLKVNAVRREQWQAKPPVRPLVPDWNFDSIVVHYTGHENYHSMADVQAYDLHHKDWDDIAYHYGIFSDGRIFEGRQLTFKGSHIKQQNTRKIGIVCVGHFDRSLENLIYGHQYFGDTVPVYLKSSLLRLSSTLKTYFPIIYFGGHKEYGLSDTCPGSNLLPVVAKMRETLNLNKPQYKGL